MIAPHAKSRDPRANVGVETKPASMADAPAERTPAPSAWTSMGPVIRGSRPMIVSPYRSPRIMPTRSARSGVTSTLPMPRIPDEPKRGTDHEMPLALERLPKLRIEVVEQELYSDVRMRTRAAGRTASGRGRMVLGAVGAADAIEEAKNEGVRPG